MVAAVEEVVLVPERAPTAPGPELSSIPEGEVSDDVLLMRTGTVIPPAIVTLASDTYMGTQNKLNIYL